MKIPLYAQAGIPEAWLVNLPQRVVEIYRDPAANGYREVRVPHLGDRLSPQAFPDFELTVEMILG